MPYIIFHHELMEDDDSPKPEVRNDTVPVHWFDTEDEAKRHCEAMVAPLAPNSEIVLLDANDWIVQGWMKIPAELRGSDRDAFLERKGLRSNDLDQVSFEDIPGSMTRVIPQFDVCTPDIYYDGKPLW